METLTSVLHWPWLQHTQNGSPQHGQSGNRHNMVNLGTDTTWSIWEQTQHGQSRNRHNMVNLPKDTTHNRVNNLGTDTT